MTAMTARNVRDTPARACNTHMHLGGLIGLGLSPYEQHDPHEI